MGQTNTRTLHAHTHTSATQRAMTAWAAVRNPTSLGCDMIPADPVRTGPHVPGRRLEAAEPAAENPELACERYTETGGRGEGGIRKCTVNEGGEWSGLVVPLRLLLLLRCSSFSSCCSCSLSCSRSLYPSPPLPRRRRKRKKKRARPSLMRQALAGQGVSAPPPCTQCRRKSLRPASLGSASLHAEAIVTGFRAVAL